MMQALIGQAAADDGVAANGAILVSLVAGEGCAGHGWLHSGDLNAGAQATRNIADLIHLLAILHGRLPGLIDLTQTQNVWPGADGWLKALARGFQGERDYLGKLAVAAGPVPATAGEAATTAAVLGQRHALETIARSERFGCALGAVAALVLDWQALRGPLDIAAERLEIAVPALALPDEEVCARLIDNLPDRPRLDRTLAFGARQLLAQHRGLLDLAEARAEARVEARAAA